MQQAVTVAKQKLTGWQIAQTAHTKFDKFLIFFTQAVWKVTRTNQENKPLKSSITLSPRRNSKLIGSYEKFAKCATAAFRQSKWNFQFSSIGETLTQVLWFLKLRHEGLKVLCSVPTSTLFLKLSLRKEHIDIMQRRNKDNIFKRNKRESDTGLCLWTCSAKRARRPTKTGLSGTSVWRLWSCTRTAEKGGWATKSPKVALLQVKSKTILLARPA